MALDFLKIFQASLVVQWLGVMDYTPGPRGSHMRKATKPMRHNYWAYALESMLGNQRSQRNGKPAQCSSKVAPACCN